MMYEVHSLWGRTSSTSRFFHRTAHTRPVEYIGRGTRLLRVDRPTLVEEPFLREHSEELKRYVQQGLVEVRAQGAGVVDFDTFVAAPPPPTPPLPHEYKASVVGVVFTQPKRYFADTPAPSESVEMPDLVAEAVSAKARVEAAPVLPPKTPETVVASVPKETAPVEVKFNQRDRDGRRHKRR